MGPKQDSLEIKKEWITATHNMDKSQNYHAESSQTQKNPYYMIPLIQHSRKLKKVYSNKKQIRG